MLSTMLVIPVLGFISDNFQTDFSEFSNLTYVKNIFSPANIGLNFHFSSQIILGYFILLIFYLYKFKLFCYCNFFHFNLRIIILIILFYINTYFELT